MRCVPGRRVLGVSVAALLACQPLAVHAQGVLTPGGAAKAPALSVPLESATTPQAAAKPAGTFDYAPFAAGLGAAVGIIGFNIAALGLGALPGGWAYVSGALVPAEMSVAMSRVYAGTSAVIGGLLGYTAAESAGQGGDDDWPISKTALATGAGAIVGIAAFNVLTAGLGTVPLAGGALAAVPYETALGSRLIAALSGGAGAVAGTAAYDAVTGERHDYGYVGALALGALGGVAAGNLLGGSLGTLPYYAGAGAEAVGVTASAAAQAASRVYVVTAGVLGAWAADWAYGRPKPVIRVVSP
ncbi:hypothetical protein [Azospirillum sp.]|uniref:hypothetical protein n=1 Tax=Azospirillum sp. TaxID=34012 RepID=UPI002D5D903F|nr:hypothetical protein [Azospirillum sp.]HYD69460.1 hypothetical protein [Azospirillum sp.]